LHTQLIQLYIMTQKDYLKFGHRYLNETTSIKKYYSFLDEIKKTFPPSKYKIFIKWIKHVEQDNSHKNSIRTNNEYMYLLVMYLNKSI
jgi:hypothetical protein